MKKVKSGQISEGFYGFWADRRLTNGQNPMGNSPLLVASQCLREQRENDRKLLQIALDRAFRHIVPGVFQPHTQFAGGRTRSVAGDELESLPLTGERRFADISWHGRGWVGADGSMAADRCPPQAGRRRSGRQVGDLAAGGLKLVHDHGVFAHRRDHGRAKRPNTSYSNYLFQQGQDRTGFGDFDPPRAGDQGRRPNVALWPQISP